MHNNYISAKKIIAQLLVDFAVDKTDMVYRMYEWIENALEIMELSNYYTNQVTPIEVKEYRAVLPCSVKYLHSIWITNTENLEVSNQHNMCLLTIRNNPLIGNGVQDLGSINNYGNIEGNLLHTSFREGKVLVVYKGVPVDCDGLPQVPDNAKVKEALPFYIIYRMSLSGYKHPLIDFTTALQLWEKYYPTAANDVNWMDQTEYQEFAEMWTNPLIGDLANNLYMH